MRSRKTLWFIIILILLSLLVDLPRPKIDLRTPQTQIAGKTIPPFQANLSDLFDLFPLKLGLDLQGGTQLVLEADTSKLSADQKEMALESAKEVIERRVNLFGVSEAKVQSSKVGEQRRILVDLPGIKDASQAADLVGRTAQLEFREVPDQQASPSAEQATDSAYLQEQVMGKPTGLTGADLKRAQVVFNQAQNSTGAQVSIQFTSEGQKKFGEITRRNIGKPLAIFLDQQLVTAPVVQSEILSGDAVITGDFTAESAKQLSIQLNAGALPIPVKIVDQRTVGAELGQESINKSIIAGIIGLLIVTIYMAVFYGGLGLIADLALIIYSIFVLAIFKTGLFILPPITLTLAGVAGFILSIGMAVDANILIFERMKEEKRWGKSNLQALELGFKRAWSSIRDSNISSLITALILYSIGTGPVKGFALTLAIGVLVSMFTAIIVTRTILRMFVRK